MDARSIAVQRAILSFLKKNGVRLVKDKKRGSLIYITPARITADEIEISVRDMATYVAGKMKPE